MNSRRECEAHRTTVEIHTYRHEFIIRKLQNYYILFLKPFVEPSSEADECTAWRQTSWNRVPKGYTCERQAGFKRVCSGLRQCRGSRMGVIVVTNKEVLEIGLLGARFRHALNSSAVWLNVDFSSSGSSPKCCSLVSVVNDKSGIINFAAPLWIELSLWNRISLQLPSQTVDA